MVADVTYEPNVNVRDDLCDVEHEENSMSCTKVSSGRVEY